MKVSMPCFCGAEGKEKSKGVIARWGLEEANPKARGEGVWYRVVLLLTRPPICTYIFPDKRKTGPWPIRFLSSKMPFRIHSIRSGMRIDPLAKKAQHYCTFCRIPSATDLFGLPPTLMSLSPKGEAD